MSLGSICKCLGRRTWRVWCFWRESALVDHFLIESYPLHRRMNWNLLLLSAFVRWKFLSFKRNLVIWRGYENHLLDQTFLLRLFLLFEYTFNSTWWLLLAVHYHVVTVVNNRSWVNLGEHHFLQVRWSQGVVVICYQPLSVNLSIDVSMEHVRWLLACDDKLKSLTFFLGGDSFKTSKG